VRSSASDYPFSTQKPYIDIVKRVSKDDEELKEKLFYKNAESLIGRVEKPEWPVQERRVHQRKPFYFLSALVG